MRQKFVHGDEVEIAKQLPNSMSHFDSGINAIVIGSYDDQYGSGNISDYTLMLLPDCEEVSWYPESSLTFVRSHSARYVRDLIQAREDRQFEEDKEYQLKRGFVPCGNSRNTWKKKE